MFKRVFLVSLFLLGIIVGCKKNSPAATTGVPNVAVSASIDVDNALYTALLNTGGWEYVTGGYDGLLVFCNSPTPTYLAFDRACPYDCETNSKAIIQVQAGNITAKCPVCGTTYSLYSGTVTKGPGSIALKQYSATYNDPYINISN